MQNQSDFYEIKTDSTSDPVTLNEAKSFLKVEHTADDDLIVALISAATSQGEKYCNRIFAQETYTGKFAGLVSTQIEVDSFIQLRRGPLISITSVKVMTDSVLTTVPATDYYLKEKPGFSRILFNTPPTSVDENVAYPLEVEFIAGYSTIPEDIKTAIKQHVNYMYENRDDTVSDGELLMPLGPKAIYSKYRILNTY